MDTKAIRSQFHSNCISHNVIHRLTHEIDRLIRNEAVRKEIMRKFLARENAMKQLSRRKAA